MTIPKTGFISPTTPGIAQPREGVIGTDRSDDLLSLDDSAMPHRALLIGAAECLWSACLVGNPAPIVRDMYERMRAPAVGDLVVEWSSGFLAARRRDYDKMVYSFGYLVARQTEWAETDADWTASVAAGEQDDNERLVDEFWYVQYGPAPEDVCRWSNCEFVTVLTDRSQFR